MEDIALPESMVRALRSERETLNALFRVRKSMHRGLNAEDFYRVLQTDVAVLVAVIEHVGGPAEALVRPLYELALDLTQRGLLGPRARTQTMTRCWYAVVLPAAYLLGTHFEVVRALLNVAFALERYPGALDKWMTTMGRVLARKPPASALLTAAQVAAWTSGLAHLRESALERWRLLDGELGRIVLGLEHDAAAPLAVLRQQLAHPFLTPGSDRDPSLKMVWEVGSFRGFGGEFLAPPMLTGHADQVFARDQHATYRLFADAFGATLERAPIPDKASGGTHFSFRKDGSVDAFGTRRTFPQLAEASSVVGNADFLAVALPWSHRITVVAWHA